MAGKHLQSVKLSMMNKPRPNEVLVLAPEGRTSSAVQLVCSPTVLCNEVVKKGVAVLCAGCTIVRAAIVVFVLLKQPRHTLATLEIHSAHIVGLVSLLMMMMPFICSCRNNK